MIALAAAEQFAAPVVMRRRRPSFQIAARSRHTGAKAPNPTKA